MKTQRSETRTGGEKIRLTNVAYLNAAPYRSAKDLDWLEYTEQPPATCARELHEGESDIALVPLAEVFSHGGYEILPFGIAAHGPVESVHLFSHCPVEEIERIFVDASSYTSVLLLRILLSELYPKLAGRVRYHRVDVDAALPALGETDGILIIGDRSLKLAREFSSALDLADLWHRHTGLPFVFAVWAYRPGALDESQRDELIRAFEHGASQRAVFAREWAEEQSFERPHAERYVSERIFYRLDESLLEGAEEFQRRGARLNIFPDSGSARPSLATMLQRPDRELRQTGAGRFSTRRDLDSLLEDASKGRRISMREADALRREASLGDLALAADLRRQGINRSPTVSYIIDRNINYTNVCNVYCRFCAFYRAPETAGRPSKKSAGGYLLTKEEIGEKIEETVRAGGIQILLQGGLNPELGIEYYEDLFHWIKANYPINLHALSADEILHIAKVSNLTLDVVFDRLIAAGLGSLPGGGAEILVDRVRRRIARLKSPAAAWLEVHRVAHRKGLRSTCTMMFGVQESWEDRILHLAKLRQLQDETGGFTAFITWPFQDDNTKLERGNTSTPEYLRVQSLSRLFLDNIENVQSSWVTMGPSVGQAALYFGANDFGSVMFEENVVSAAGTTYCMDSALIERHIREAGFVPWRRNMHYQAAR